MLEQSESQRTQPNIAHKTPFLTLKEVYMHANNHLKSFDEKVALMKAVFPADDPRLEPERLDMKKRDLRRQVLSTKSALLRFGAQTTYIDYLDKLANSQNDTAS